MRESTAWIRFINQGHRLSALGLNLRRSILLSRLHTALLSAEPALHVADSQLTGNMLGNILPETCLLGNDHLFVSDDPWEQIEFLCGRRHCL